MTNLYTCLDGFAYSKGHVRDKIEKKLLQRSHHVSNSLAMLNKVPRVKKLTTSSESDEVFPEYGKMQKGFPFNLWRTTSKEKRKLECLQKPLYNSICRVAKVHRQVVILFLLSSFNLLF
ncbi:Methionine aminopeptidase 2B isoform A [Glycine soja]|uniref:Methionine aminopeptidase 2B isoform A n=1 Tax=Glycine soja TaxID=3848 RepID=A0A445LMH2_GLYSO|nr:Methionine aminopeptidase 2B isoform A [Glycine soja]